MITWITNDELSAIATFAREWPPHRANYWLLPPPGYTGRLNDLRHTDEVVALLAEHPEWKPFG